MRGREREQQTIRDRLTAGAGGTGAVVLVDGQPGMGRSLLLRTTVDDASRQGFSLAVAAAEPLGRAIPLLALRGALGEPFAQFAASDAGHERHDGVAWWVGQMRAHLEQRATSTPVLVCIDDVQWACPATLAALLSLPRALANVPVVWVLARSSVPHPDSEYLFEGLVRGGAEHLTLRPLDDGTVATLLTDAFGAPPDAKLLGLAKEAAGNPALVMALIEGLRDDEAVQGAGQHAALVSDRLPQRVHRVARQRLDDLGKPAQHLVVTACVLGPSFRLDDAAKMMGETPAALLPAVEEAMAAGILTTTQNTFAFRHQLLRRALDDMMPPGGRTALHRQYGQLLLGRGAVGGQAAGHLLQAVHEGDQASLADLDAAVVQTSRSAPQAAASLALRALELTPATDRAALSRTVVAAEALAAAGRLDQAAHVAERALAQPLPAADEARLRCALSSVLCSRGQARDAAAEARMALAHPELTPELRDQAMTAHLRALSELHDELAAPLADSILGAHAQHDQHAVVHALVARAGSSSDSGELGDALELMRAAARQGTEILLDARHGQPLIALAAALIDLRQLADAQEILHTAGGHLMDAVPAQAAVSVLRARIDLIRGRPADAEANAQEALATAERIAARGYAAAAHHALGLIALRRGDISTAAHHIARHSEAAPHASPYWRTETALAQAEIIAARDGATAAADHVRAASADLVAHRGLLLRAPATAAGLVRIALAAGDKQLAAALADAAGTLAADNPGYPAVNALSAHCRGLVDQDLVRLAEAAAEHPDGWAKASAAEDLGELHARLADQDNAVTELTRAIEGYESIGATADTARVRSRLRKLGVRRRHWTRSTDRPATGWESLTDAEHSVSDLVAVGLNNAQIAARMYLSTSTVAFHLRQTFRKLDISSRVELARIVIQHTPATPGHTVSTAAG